MLAHQIKGMNAKRKVPAHVDVIAVYIVVLSASMSYFIIVQQLEILN